MGLVPLRDRILGNLTGRSPALLVDVPEWGLKVGIKRLTVGERLVFEATHGAMDSIDPKDRPNYYRWILRYVILCACDEHGQRLFQPEDEARLEGAAYTAVERLGIAALRANSVTAEELADLGKASGEAPNGASPSASPATLG